MGKYWLLVVAVESIALAFKAAESKIGKANVFRCARLMAGTALNLNLTNVDIKQLDDKTSTRLALSGKKLGLDYCWSGGAPPSCLGIVWTYFQFL